MRRDGVHGERARGSHVAHGVLCVRLHVHGQHGIVVGAHSLNLADGSRGQHLRERNVIGVRLDIAAKHVLAGHGGGRCHLTRVSMAKGALKVEMELVRGRASRGGSKRIVL